MPANIYDMTDTWGAAGTAFSAIKMNVTNTASAAGSKLMDLQVGGNSAFEIQKTGVVKLWNSASTKYVHLYADTNPLVGVDALYLWDRPLTGGSTVNLGLPKTMVMAATATWCDTNVLDGIWYTSCWLSLQNSTATIKLAPAAGIAWCSSADFSSATDDLFLRRDAANTLAQRNGTSPQSFRVYNTYTDASNYERGVFDWTTNANTLTIGAQKAGAGTLRGVVAAGSWTFNSITVSPTVPPYYLLYLDGSRYINTTGGTNICIGNVLIDCVLGTVRTSPLTVSALPSASTAGAGTRSFVTDANATTFNTTVAGGGSNSVPVFSDGTNWKIG